MSHPLPQHAALLSKFGHMVSIWNDVEYQWTSALLMFEHPETYEVSGTAQILAAHLGAVQIENAAKTVANEILYGDCRDFILKSIELFSVLREYRNYYVHGFQAVGLRSDGIPVGFLLTITARGRLTQHDTWFEEKDIDTLIDGLNFLRTAFGKVLLVWRRKIDPITSQPYQLPDSVPSISRLEKSKRFLFEYRRSGSVE